MQPTTMFQERQWDWKEIILIIKIALAKAHHGVQRGVVDEGTGVEGAVGCDLKETRDGDSLGGHEALKLGWISTKFGKEGFRAEQDCF